MSELADDAAEGVSCSWCGTYFNGAHGFPVVCQSCTKGTSPSELAVIGLRVATRSEL